MDKSESSSGPQLLTIQPAEEIVFNAGANGEMTSKIQVTNSAAKSVIFKVNLKAKLFKH